MVRDKKRKYAEKKPDEDGTEGETSAPQTSESVEGTSNINRRARIIVRNLPFKSTEVKLKEHFEKYGPVTEVKILKRPDGKLVGCGFIQFEVVQNAAKAIFHTTMKPFLGRNIVCDWAMGKKTYVQNMKEAMKKEIKVENDEPIEIKDETLDEDVKEDIKDEETTDVKSESDSDEEDSEKESSSEDEEESDEEEEANEEEEPDTKRPRIISNDIEEGKTIFIKNVPFSAKNDDIGECLSQFGPLYYALVCVDRVTEHSKGTAFVKFRNQEDAEKCLQAGTELTLLGNVLDCHRAVSKNDLGNKQSQKKDDRNDSRNLYLVKEGVIYAGTKAAEGVSASDMAKRLELERWKTQMLRNLNMFISNNRLVIQNLPPTFDDSKLRQLVTKFVGPNTAIREARVMRDIRNLDDKGNASSKEFGFVAFDNHEAALRLLRSLNNNPNIFSKTKRPIVAFSIENKTVINARTKRMERSKMNNPTYKNYNPNTREPQNYNQNKRIGKNDSKNQKEEQGAKPKKYFGKLSFKNDWVADNTEKEFTGVTAKPGYSKLRSKFKLKTQAMIHHENLKSEKKKQKNVKKSLGQRRQEFIRQPGQKQNTNKKKSDDNFSKLVDKYKNNLIASTQTTKSKWYDT